MRQQSLEKPLLIDEAARRTGDGLVYVAGQFGQGLEGGSRFLGRLPAQLLSPHSLQHWCGSLPMFHPESC